MVDVQSPILITGGTGFVGSHLLEELISRGFQNIYVTTYSAPDAFATEKLAADHIIQVDLSKLEPTRALIEQIKPVWLFHLAAIASAGRTFEQATAIFQNNISLQLNMLESIKEASPATRLLVVGSAMEYGASANAIPVLKSNESLDSAQYPSLDELAPLSPTSDYAVSKVTQDLLGLSYVHSHNLDIVRVRPFNHIGERQTTDFAIPAFAEQIVKIERGEQEKLKVGNLEAVRDFSDVKDVVKAYILLLEKGVRGEVYNVGSGKGFTMQTVLAKLTNLSTKQIDIEIDEERMRPSDVPYLVSNIKKIKSIGWSPAIPLEVTLERVLEEWRTK